MLMRKYSKIEFVLKITFFYLSFPVHYFLIKRAASVFDEVIVGIGVNPSKHYIFSLEERTSSGQFPICVNHLLTETDFRRR